MTNSLKNKLYLHIFIILKKSQKIVLYILDLITSLLISLELGLYFKIIKKQLSCFFLIHEITNLYVRCIFDIKFKIQKNLLCFLLVSEIINLYVRCNLHIK